MITKTILRFLLASIFVFCLLSPAASASAGVNIWTRSGPEGGYITSIAIAPSAPNTLYVGTYYGGIFKTTNGGGYWYQINTGLPTPIQNHVINAIVVDAADPQIVYAGTNGLGVFKSINGGASWNACSSGLPIDSIFKNINVRSLTIDPVNPQILYAAVNGNEAYHTLDGGANWNPINTGLPADISITAIEINRTVPNNLILASHNQGIYKSTNSGGNWNASNTGLTDKHVNDLAIAPGGPVIVYVGTDSGVFKSVNGGDSWTASNAGIMTLSVSQLAINPVSPQVIYIGTNMGTVYKSTDGGSQWNPANTGLAIGGVNCLVINPLDPQIVYISSIMITEGVFKTMNGGQNWAKVNSGFTNISTYTLLIDPTVPDTLYGSTNNGIYKSIDHGLSWKGSNTGIPPGNTGGPLVMDPTASNILYAGTSLGGLYKSTDSGGTWTSSSAGLSASYISALTIDPLTPTTLYAVVVVPGSGAIETYISINSGGSWNQLSGLQFSVFTLQVAPTNPATLYVGTTYGVFKMVNGQYWMLAIEGMEPNTNIKTMAIDPVTPTTLFAGGKRYGLNGGYPVLYKSVDSGDHWTAIDLNFGTGDADISSVVIDPATPNTIYVGSRPFGIFKSSDGGVHWGPFNPALQCPFINVLAIDPVTPHLLYAGASNGVYSLQLSERRVFVPTIKH